jgi:dTDP-4-dehydrorhamnose reductase
VKIFIAGAGGMLGSSFHNILQNGFEVVYYDKNPSDAWLQQLDFTNETDYHSAVGGYSPDWLFHIGAETDLEICERDEEGAFKTNACSVGYAVDIANQLNIPLLYIGTAGIFSGEKSYFDEDDNPEPLGAYARSKFLGECLVRARSRDYLICRAGWMMGGGPDKDKKFIGKVCKQILSGAKELNIVNDKLGTPTYTHDFAHAILMLIKNNVRGLFNLVCEGNTSRLEVARHLLACLNLNRSVSINEVPSSYFSNEYFAPRPDCEALRNKRLRQQNVRPMRDWKDALRSYIEHDWSALFRDI